MNARSALALVLILVAAPAALAGSGAWRPLPAAPVAIDAGLTSVWTGRQMLVFGVTGVTAGGSFLKATNAGASYDPATRTWRRLPAVPGPTDFLGSRSAAWTGKEMLVWGPFSTMAYNPATRHWRRLPRGHGGLVAWTGRELIGWGGGCCGDAFSDGVAYNPATGRWRALARSPLAGSQHPIGAWTGRELIVLVGGLDPNGKPWPAQLARAAAYDPAAGTWRRIAPLPEPRGGATAVWDGRELLVVGGAADPRGGKPAPAARVGFAYDPAANRWRRLAPMPSGRLGATVVWAGKRLLVWGGQTAQDTRPESPPRGFAYDPAANRWSPLPRSPLSGRLGQTAVWTGRALILWGGGVGHKGFSDGAAFTP